MGALGPEPTTRKSIVTKNRRWTQFRDDYYPYEVQIVTGSEQGNDSDD